MTSLALPPFIMTSEEGSYARKTIAARKPLIIDQILVDNDYPQQIQDALLGLKAELLNGQVRLLNEDTEDKPVWDHDMQPWMGKSWLEIPWFLAETFFFRRVLEAIGYFQPGSWQGKDPYHLMKEQEFTRALPQFITTYDQAIHENTYAGFSQAVQNALWGNQADLSNLDDQIDSSGGSQQQLIRDDSIESYNLFKEKPLNIIYFLDNVGRELYFDLALMDYLLQYRLAASITVLLKNQPFFVSDVMTADFEYALKFLGEVHVRSIQALVNRTQKALQQGQLQLEAPSFLTTGRMYRQLPEELKAKLQAADLALLKGDVNYRRLVGDRHWEPTTPLGRAAGYFPTTFISLRTQKAELVVGLENEQIDWFNEYAEPDWMTSGKWGLISFLKK